jgi:hypothetical integral membrane protein (TIGR02206 family)
MNTDFIHTLFVFWREKIAPYLTTGYHGKPFQLFDSAHLAALSVIVALILLITLTRHKYSETTKRRIRNTMAAILIINEISWHLWAYFYGQWNIQTMLPLHLCSVLVWLSAWMLINKSYRIYEFAYLLGIGGALQALLTPDVGIYGYPHYRFFQTFISHGLIVVAAAYMTLAEEMRPTGKSILRVFIFSNLYMLAVYGINTLIGSNYLYVNAKPATASVLDLLPDWPVYILYMEAIGIVTILILYSPFLIKDFIEKRRMRLAGQDRLDELLS